MKDATYFQITGTECEHSFIEYLLRKGLKEKGCELIYYRQLKSGHIPMRREGKINAPRWVILDVCMEKRISDIEIGGFLYRNGVQFEELYDWPRQWT